MAFAGGHSDAGSDQYSGPALKRADQPTRENRNLDREIEALIPRLTRYARALTRDVDSADDLVQDCLVRALGKIHLWEPGTDLRAWLFTILHNQHVSLARCDARQPARIELQQDTAAVSCPPGQATRLEVRDLERAIRKLPEEQRKVVLLVGLDGMQYDEAASIVKLPVGTVRSRVARGRETLRIMTGLFPSRHVRRPRRAGVRSMSAPKCEKGDAMRILSVTAVAAALLAGLANTPVSAQQREIGPMPQLHAVNPSLSVTSPTNNPLQDQMRQDYATSLLGAQRELMQQNPSGLGRQEQAIGRELNGYMGPR